MQQLDQLEQRIGRLEAVIDRWIVQQGLTYNAFAVLYSLARADGGNCTQKDIGEAWLLPKQTVFSTCKVLTEQGLLTQQPDNRDKRARQLCLTDAGRAQALPLLAAAEAFSARLFDAFGSERTAHLLAELDALNTVAETIISAEENRSCGAP